MNFPDQPHLHQLQSDLWHWPGSRAAVLVGAGLSLNTEPLPGVKSRFPTWRQLVWSMFDELYPRGANETEKEKQVRRDQFTGISSLRLASEYEAAFGQCKLELLIRTQNPDTEHLPSSLHRLLLQLPWKDVFTTNYDTLLERTEVSGRAYQPVTTAAELTTTFSPRIIKLHGSLPSQTPFIITEEDYRTYPIRYAPFVNTVQQSLIENSLVMVGFSGDDSNFLQWIGWIRDHLGDRHAPIYLVGPLSLSNAQRTLLECRGVTPIDLSPVLSKYTPAVGIHAASLEWFIRSLLAAKNQRPEKWPEVDRPAEPSPTTLPPIIGSRSEPPPSAVGLSPESNAQMDDEAVANVVSRWKFERNQYHGWLVAPNTVRFRLWDATKFWIHPLTESIADWSAADRILVLRELNWRFEISMVPLFPQSINPFQKAFDECCVILESGEQLSSSIDRIPFLTATHSDIIEAWLEIGFGLLREARETYNSEKWSQLKQKIDQVVCSTGKSSDRIHYEEVLWRISNVERIRAKNELSKWNPSPNSPLATMWKASLLAELDELGEAQSLLRIALRNTRYALRRQGQSIELLSIEGWCTYNLFAVEQVLDPGSRETRREEFFARWSELKAWDCDPWSTKEYFDAALAGLLPKPQKNGKSIIRGFDPGVRTVSHNWSGDHVGPWLPAFACIRYFEQVGIPLRLPQLNISGDALHGACEWVAPFIGYWSPAILIRSGKVKELRSYDFMSRVGVAVMESKTAQRLHKWAIDGLTREIALLNGRIATGSAQESLLKTLPELLSRLSFRVDADALEQSFQLAIQFHRAPEIRSNIRLHETCEPWFRRIFEAATESQLLQWLPALIRAPFFDEATHSVIPKQHAWPDPMQHYPSRGAREVAIAEPAVLPDIISATDWLLRRCQSEAGESRRRVLARLIDVYYSELMTTEQRVALGELMWHGVEESELPDLPLAYFSFLHLPSPDDIRVVDRIKEQILTMKPTKNVSVRSDGRLATNLWNPEDQMILEVALDTKPVVHLPDETMGVIEWTQEEANSLWRMALDWWNNDKAILGKERPGDMFDGLGKDPVLATLKRFDLFLARAVLPYMEGANDEEWSVVFDVIAEARAKGVHMGVCLPYILLHRPTQIAELEATIRGGLAMGAGSAVKASALAVRHWVHLAGLGLIGEPAPGVLRDLVMRVIFRRPEEIESCIRQVALLLVERPEAFSWETVQLLVASLVPWHGAVQLPCGDAVGGDFPVQDRPDLRALLGMLSSALSHWMGLKMPEIDEPSEIRLWRETCEQDTLPEVKRSFHTWDYLEFDTET